MGPCGLVILARLGASDQPLAVTYGHLFGNTYHDYQRGVDLPARKVSSPGTATLMLFMTWLAYRDVTTFDHLAGTNSS